MPTWKYDDGGRSAAGFKGETRDCVTRALAIATREPYADVYAELFERAGESPRLGVKRATYQAFLLDRGWTWTPTMQIGQGCKVHLRADELPSGVIVARLSRHLCAVVDGIALDTFDPARGGTRCVYGYYAKLPTL